jgi:hypothetical protein
MPPMTRCNSRLWYCFGMPVQVHKGGRDGRMKSVEARLMPLLVRFKAIWGGLAGTGAGSSISCRCVSPVAAIR